MNYFAKDVTGNTFANNKTAEVTVSNSTLTKVVNETIFYNKFDPETGTCGEVPYPNLFQGFNTQIKDTFFFSFIIQFILVSLMYIHVGNGKYWKVLFFAATAGLIAAAIENATIAFICQEDQTKNHGGVFTFFVEEFFWIVCEYSVPYLNLIKMEAISNGKYVKFVKFIILLLAIPFGAARLYNGYDRMVNGVLDTKITKICHGIAFGVMAVADIICTISIIYLVKKKIKKGTFRNKSMSSYIKNSTYTVLISVDMVSLCLSILYIVSSLIFQNKSKDLDSSTSIFHCLKSVIILILATDAIIFKYGATNNTFALYDMNSRLNQYDYYFKKTMNNNNKTFIIDMNNDNASSTSRSPYSTYKFPSSLANSKNIVRSYNSQSPTLDSNKKKFGGDLFHQTDLKDYMYKNN